MLTIIERKNESVEVTNPVGEVTTYPPVFDLAAAKTLLEQINALKTEDGTPIYAYWQYQGYYLYPALQEWLFWHVCIALVRHSQAWNALRGHEVVFEKEPFYTASTLKGLFDILYCQRKSSERFLYNACAIFLRFLAKPFSSVVVYDDGPEGFRYRKLKAELAGIAAYSRLDTLHHPVDAFRFLKDHSAFCLGLKAWRYSSPPSIDYSTATCLHPYLNQGEFQALIAAIHRRCSDKIAEIPVMEKALGHHPPQLFIGYDQIEEAAAFVVACKLRAIPVITYQHGLYTGYHCGWNAPGIPPEYCNIASDKLVVWGEHWKQVLLKHSNKYGEQHILVGAHLRNDINYGAWPTAKRIKSDRLTILLPFEFLADNRAISAYIKRFLALGWRVWMKMRPAGFGGMEDRYAFDEDVRDQITYLDAIGAKELEQIDIVAFTQSTVAYEMMPYNKPIWYLDTPFRFFDVEQEGMAHRITHDLLDKCSDSEQLQPLLQPIYTQEHYKAVFSDQQLKEVLQRLIDKPRTVS